MKTFLLLGCSRSGEIEVGACLRKLPDLQWLYSFEIRRHLDEGDAIETPGETALLGLDATRHTLSIEADSEHLNINDAPTFIFLVREPRACVAHMAARRLGPLLNAFGMPTLDQLRAQWPSEVAIIEAAAPEIADYGRAALWWKMNYAVLQDLRESGADVIAVSFDSFSENPAAHLRAICAELGVTYSDDLKPASDLEYSDDDWRERLSVPQREIIEQIGNSAMRSAWTTGRRG